MGLDLSIFKVKRTDVETNVAANLTSDDLESIEISDGDLTAMRPIERDQSLDSALFAVEVDIEMLVKEGVKRLHVIVWG